MKIWIIALVLTILVVGSLGAGQTDERLEVRLHAAVFKELVDGDLQAAIEQYQDIAARSGGNRVVAANALVQLGQAYEKLGDARAREVYERIVRDFADQREPLRLARAHLAQPESQEQASGAANTAALAVRPIWAEAIENYLKRAKVVRAEDLGTGVNPVRRVELEPGGLIDAFAWNTVQPGIYRGRWESYKVNIAAYELDKLLGLEMVPVTVEKRINGVLGAAIVWVGPVKSFSELGGVPTPPSTHIGVWNLQLIRAKMFDNLIHNTDSNLGNWLVDPAWNIILVDHMAAFTPGHEMVHQMTRVDRTLWGRMKSLTVETLTSALGEWLSEEEIRGILERRDRMEAEIDKMVEARGELRVFVR